MKKFVLAVTIIISIGMVIYITFNIYLKNKIIKFDENGKFYINDNIYLESTSRYAICLKGSFYIPEYVAEIGWNEEYIVILQYNLIMANNESQYKIPNKSELNYYLIDLKENKMIGPITKEEISKYSLESIDLKKTSL